VAVLTSADVLAKLAQVFASWDAFMLEARVAVVLVGAGGLDKSAVRQALDLTPAPCSIDTLAAAPGWEMLHTRRGHLAMLHTSALRLPTFLPSVAAASAIRSRAFCDKGKSGVPKKSLEHIVGTKSYGHTQSSSCGRSTTSTSS
jgi:hypothetical protein